MVISICSMNKLKKTYISISIHIYTYIFRYILTYFRWMFFAGKAGDLCGYVSMFLRFFAQSFPALWSGHYTLTCLQNCFLFFRSPSEYQILTTQLRRGPLSLAFLGVQYTVGFIHCLCDTWRHFCFSWCHLHYRSCFPNACV